MTLAAFVFCLYYCILLVITSDTKLNIVKCCADPITAFKIKPFSGSCGCQSLSQKWNRFKDWVQLNHGYIHKDIEMRYLNNSLTERGIFTLNDIPWTDLIMQIPIKITASQFIISKYIAKNDKIYSKSKDLKRLFPAPKDNYFMPSEFPDWYEFEELKYENQGDNEKPKKVSKVWLALGLSWIQKYTDELLPWFDLLPVNIDHLPILWDTKTRNKWLQNTPAANALSVYETAITRHYVYKYIKILNVDRDKVLYLYAILLSNAFGLPYKFIKNGAESSPSIPCGHNFFNHNQLITSSNYIYPYFGNKKMQKKIGNKDTKFVTNTIKKEINLERSKPAKVDFESVYLWLDYDMKKGQQLWLNYGKRHSSTIRFAKYGFIDNIHPNDFILLDLNFDNAGLWNMNQHYIEAIDCYQDYRLVYDGREILKIDQDKLECLRVLSMSYDELKGILNQMDPYMIKGANSVLKMMDLDHIHNEIDTKVVAIIHRNCKYNLDQYETTIKEDKMILREMEIDKSSNVMRSALLYRLRIKEFYGNCSKVVVSKS